VTISLPDHAVRSSVRPHSPYQPFQRGFRLAPALAGTVSYQHRRDYSALSAPPGDWSL